MESEVISSLCPKEIIGAVGVGYLMYQGYKYIWRSPRHIFPDGSCYEGYLVNGKKEGKGKLIEPNGAYYEGEWVNDKMEGKGKYMCSDGDYYEGDWMNDRKEGKGKYMCFNGAYYEGDWVNGERGGKGRCKYLNGDYYEGDWVNGRMEGKGKYICSNGDYYEGDWVNSRKEGKGKYMFSGGHYYEGGWVKGEMDGKGKYISCNGDSCEGEWAGGLMVSSNYNNLSDDLFFDVLCGSRNRCYPNGYCFGIFLDYLQKKGYKETASSLGEAWRCYKMNLEEAEKESHVIYSELIHEKKSKLLCYGHRGHAMGLRLVPEVFPGFILCEIFNTGEGLNYHTKHFLDNFRCIIFSKYKTMLQIKVPVESLTQEKIKGMLLWKEFENIDKVYGHILNLPRVKIISSDSFLWQAKQKGNDCSFRWMLAFCKNTMSEKEYKRMHQQLKDDCTEARKARLEAFFVNEKLM